MRIDYTEIAGIIVIAAVAYWGYLNQDKVAGLLNNAGGLLNNIGGSRPRTTAPSPTRTVAPAPAGSSASACDPNLSKFVWQIPGTVRLQVKGCLTLIGTVGRTSSAPDGDYNFDLKLDSQYAKYKSTQGSHGANVWCEVICQSPVRNSSSAEASLDKYRHACPGCNCYKGKKFSYLPKTGDHVKVTGIYVKDVREGGHMELHPVSNIAKI